MSKYINVDALLNSLPEDLPYKASVKRVLIQAPSADVEEVRHGEWVVDAYNGDEIVRIPYAVHQHNDPYCSLCGSYALLDGKEDYVISNFCHRCGAKMRGERSTKDAT